jgi:hypothetical protein
MAVDSFAGLKSLCAHGQPTEGSARPSETSLAFPEEEPQRRANCAHLCATPLTGPHRQFEGRNFRGCLKSLIRDGSREGGMGHTMPSLSILFVFPKPVRQGLVCLDVANDFLLFLFRQSWHVTSSPEICGLICGRPHCSVDLRSTTAVGDRRYKSRIRAIWTARGQAYDSPRDDLVGDR